MPTSLTGNSVNNTYNQLLHIDGGPTAVEKTVHSGTGVATALKLGTESVSVDNVRIDGSTISTVAPNSDLVLAPNGSGKVQIGNVNITGGQLFGTTPTSAGLALLGAADAAEQRTLLGALSYGLFYKADPATVAFTKTGAGTASIRAGTKVDVAGTTVTFSTATAITMPALAAGTDYAIWVKDDATIEATANFSTAPGTGNWRKIGGFHYAPGGNAAAQAGGDTTPAINEYSFWDLKFRPACPDPRGMTLVADLFWADIYLLGVNHHINGTSKYNVAIADGASPPKVPTKFGGDGSTTYNNLNWWVAAEVLRSHGKRMPTYDEFAALAYGTTEGISSGGTDMPTTGVTGTGATYTWNKFTSRWGVIQSTGCMIIWGADFGWGTGEQGWTDNTEGRGYTYQLSNVIDLGGGWNTVNGASGSRCSSWNKNPTYTYNFTSARGVCDHLIIY